VTCALANTATRVVGVNHVDSTFITPAEIIAAVRGAFS